MGLLCDRAAPSSATPKQGRVTQPRFRWFYLTQRDKALKRARIAGNVQQAHQRERFAPVDVRLAGREEIENGRLVVDENFRCVHLDVPRGFVSRKAGGERSVRLGKD